MATFITKKKKYRFQVDVRLDELIEVPLVSAVLFAKLRLLDGGNFQEYSTREELKDHKVKWGAQFEFACKMTANASTGVLEPCMLRISVRKEIKGGRSFQKLGFSDINLAELAGSGMVSKQYLLEGYDTKNRQDNSMLRITVKMNMLSGDILFKVPSPTSKLPHTVVPSDEMKSTMIPDGNDSGSSLSGSVNSGFGSLPKKRPPILSSEIWTSGNNKMISGSVTGEMTNDKASKWTPVLSNDIRTIVTTSEVATNDKVANESTAVLPSHSLDASLSHSRNSSSTSQASKASGNSSSGGESSHQKNKAVPNSSECSNCGNRNSSGAQNGENRISINSTTSFSTNRTSLSSNFGSNRASVNSTTTNRTSINSTNSCTCSNTFVTIVTQNDTAFQYTGLTQRQSSFSSVQKNPSGSSLNLLETGSLDRGKSALERRNKRLDLNSHDTNEAGSIASSSLVSGRVEITRPDRYNLIEEIIKAADLKKGHSENLEGGLQLFIAEDGTAALGNQEVKSQISSGVQAFKEVVIDERHKS